MKDLNNVFSFDEKKIKISDNCVHKISNIIEYQNLLHLREKLKGSKILIDNKRYTLYIPHVYSYHDGMIKMEYFSGNNLELLLRNPVTHNYAVKILNGVLLYIIQNEIWWSEFAPRNILISNNTICLIDFEKEIDSFNNKILFLRNHVYEEYISFIFYKERIFDDDQIFKLQDNENNFYFPISDIKIKRILYLAKLYLKKNIISYQDYLFLYKMITNVETPYISNEGEFVFPRIHLGTLLIDKEIDNNAYNNYCSEVIKRYEKSKIRHLF